MSELPINFTDPNVAQHFAGSTDSPYAYYKMVFDLPSVPSVILDMGCGANASFARAPENSQHTVYSLSPYIGRMSLFEDENPRLFLAATAQEIPLADNSIDTIVSANAVPAYVPGLERPAAYAESTRILKPGGTAQFYPFIEEAGDNSLDSIKDQVAMRVDMIDDPLAHRLPPEIAQILDTLLPRQQMPRLTLTKL